MLCFWKEMWTSFVLFQKFIPGKLLDIFCRNCHNKMQFAADSVKFQVITTSEVDASKCKHLLLY